METCKKLSFLPLKLRMEQESTMCQLCRLLILKILVLDSNCLAITLINFTLKTRADIAVTTVTLVTNTQTYSVRSISNYNSREKCILDLDSQKE